MLESSGAGLVRGFTTNPTLMRKAGITNYAAFAQAVLAEISDLPISFEVFADEFLEMERQALVISSWGKNVFVKIPITNTKGESSVPLIRNLVTAGVKLNVTAIMAERQGSTVATGGCPVGPAMVCGVGAPVPD